MKEKKFRVRLKHYDKDKYCIQYANYRWFPIWWNLMIYVEGVGWHDLHLTLPLAEEFASLFKSYYNVLALFSIEQKKEMEYKKKLKEKKESEVPFKVKEIYSKGFKIESCQTGNYLDIIGFEHPFDDSDETIQKVNPDNLDEFETDYENGLNDIPVQSKRTNLNVRFIWHVHGLIV